MKKFKYAWLAFVIVSVLALVPAFAAEKEAPPVAPADGTLADGVLTRTNAPAFTIEIPDGLKAGKPDVALGGVYTGAQGVEPWTVQVYAYDLEGDLAAAAKASGDSWLAWAKGIGSEGEVITVESIDAYDDFKAMLVEVEYVHTDGSTVLTILTHLIQKGDKVIQLSGWVMSNFDALIEIFESIDLDP